MFFVFPEGGFSIAVDLCKLPTDFRPPFAAAEDGRLAAELGREDCRKKHASKDVQLAIFPCLLIKKKRTKERKLSSP